MTRSELTRPPCPVADDVLRTLSIRQHLRPHRQLGDALGDLAGACGLCPAAAAQVLARIGLDADGAIGRLTRAELTRLSRVLSRLCRHSLSGVADGEAIK